METKEFTESKEEIWHKMVEGEIYDATHPELLRKLEKTRDLLWEFNLMKPSRIEDQKQILHRLLGSHGVWFQFNQPFRCDYGENIHIGECFFANFNLTILDEAEVRIGDYCFIGPNVSIYTACHPLDSEQRNKAVEWAEPVTIGDNVWIGGSVTICPGVKIGDNVVIGAGSTVVKDIPSNVVAAGNPARIVKHI
ncbi:MAG: sugar O-acetyltransferase [Muribaculaceae bacterium]|nr:sugar O-acetyltransferase [Muribaculaceae bacterium]